MDAVAPRLRPPLGVPRRLLRLRSDAVLAERFAAGDESAFAVLYERHRASVLAVCMGVLGSNHDAEDSAQDAFAALAIALRDHPPRELRAWLARVARNAAIDVARRRRRTVTTDGEVPDVPAATSGAKAELEHVMVGIRELPESQRTALLMRELAGHSYAEIAALLETDEEAIRGLIARARMGLRTHREASELSCVSARATLAAEPNGSTRDKTVRRHVRGCAPCRAYKQALRNDARALRGLLPVPAGGVAGGGAIFGGLAAKGALVGGAMTQMTAACAVSACAVGGVVLLYPSPHVRRPAQARVAHAVAAAPAGDPAGDPGAGHRASGPTGSAPASDALAPGASAGARAQFAAARAGSAGSAGPAAGTRWAPRTGAQAGSAAGTARISGTSPAGGSNSRGGSRDAGVPAGYTGFTSSARPSPSAGAKGSIGSIGGSAAGPAAGSQAAGSQAAGSQAAGRQPGAGSGTQRSATYQRPGAGSAPSGSAALRQRATNRPAGDSAGATAQGGSPWGRAGSDGSQA